MAIGNVMWGALRFIMSIGLMMLVYWLAEQAGYSFWQSWVLTMVSFGLAWTMVFATLFSDWKRRAHRGDDEEWPDSWR